MNRSESEATVSVRHLTYAVRRKTILDDLSFELERGTTVILGPNGAGKSTLFRILSTAQACACGKVALLGFDVGRGKERRALRPLIGYMPQNLDFYASFTVSDLVTYIGLLKGIGAREIDQLTVKALNRVGLQSSSSTKLGNLSGGMLRRATIAQAIVNDPKILILDEPTAGLDPGQRRSFGAVIEEISSDRTVILSTHLVEDVLNLASKVLVLDDGHVVFHDTPDALARLGGDDDARDSIDIGFEAVLKRSRVRR